jgi:diaminohydroxyphosphoribosylaminopyrimidine deaminase/5-amino-6-(5-phosphoribosylamino)uracil reductase
VDKDVYYMKQALKLAKSGLGQTSPNPSVGCIIVKNDVIISSARTQKGGRPHAESIAIHNSQTDVSGATIYITLEPCCTLERNKTSCLDKIIAAKFSRVVIGTTDPNPKINGKSIEVLQQNGVEVKVGALKESCQEMVSGFKKRMLTNMPFITLKLAISLDGKIALKNGQSKWITSEKQRKAAHKLRAQNDAILTGIGTVIADDPLLTCRLPRVDHNPIRVILDTDFKIPEHSQITQTSREVRTIIFTAKEISKPYKTLEVITVKRGNYGLCLNDVLRKLAELGINNLLVEAGQKINTSFIQERLIDRLVVFQSNKIIGADGLNAIGELNVSELEKCPQFNTVLIGDK